MNVTAVIPVRLDSKRFPGKALADVGGKPLIRLVFDRVRQAGCLDRTLIATDSPEVEAACREFTDDIFFSTTRHLCGTDRVAEACGAIDTDVIVNVQTDEPMMEPALIDTLAGLFDAPALDFATAAAPIRTFEEFLDPNVVKVVCDAAGDALYFSRAPIPWDRDAPPSGAGPLPDGFRAWKHIGIYLYRKAALTTLAGLPRAELEIVESLEQLRVLDRGWKMRVLEWDYRGIDVDTKQDLQRLRRVLLDRPERTA